MATRRKMARSAIRRVKRHASKNVRHKLKTHRRKHRKIVMRGGGEYNAHYYFKHNKLQCVLVEEAMGFVTKDTLFMFWPVYVTDEELKKILKQYIKPEKINEVFKELVKDKPEFEPSIESMALPKYLKLSSMKTGRISSSYNPTITVKSLVDKTKSVETTSVETTSVETTSVETTSVEIPDALVDKFDRKKFKIQLGKNVGGEVVERRLAGENENIEFKKNVIDNIGNFSSTYVSRLCNDEFIKEQKSKAANDNDSSATSSNVSPRTWCGRHSGASPLKTNPALSPDPNGYLPIDLQV
jgi:hypothetical protein